VGLMGIWADSVSTWFGALTRPERAAGLVIEEGRGAFARVLVVAVAVLYAFYGLSMGLYHGVVPGVVSALKLPVLYVITLVICFPAFYALSALHAQRLTGGQCARLLLMATSANALALASFAPMSFFFTFTTSRAGYNFIVVLQVAVFAAAAALSVVEIGLIFRAVAARLGRRVPVSLIGSWAVLYAFVLSQMSWVLRPWLGTWTTAYQPFRPIGGSFIEWVLNRVF
jgi:hypothetical protein